MSQTAYRALVADRDPEGNVRTELRTLEAGPLAEGEVRLEVRHSSLNYKDALAACGHRGIIGELPHVPGIDAAGVVLESRSPSFQSGDEVLATSYEIGATRAGGWAERLDAPAAWIVPKPVGLSLREAMILGTAGLTAAMCVEELERNEVTPESGPVVVTGASGGVGSFAVQLLAKLGYRVTAVSGKESQHAWLRELGAVEIVDRTAVHNESGRPLLSSHWAGAIDTVGGTTLTTLIRTLQPFGCVAAVGLVGGEELPLTVHPFILRGVTLAGVSTANTPYERRVRIWRRLAGPWKPNFSQLQVTEVGLMQLPEQVEQMLAGNAQGRVLVTP